MQLTFGEQITVYEPWLYRHSPAPQKSSEAQNRRPSWWRGASLWGGNPGQSLCWTRPCAPTKDSLNISVQSLCCVRLFATPWTAARQASPSITNSQGLPKLMSIESVI